MFAVLSGVALAALIIAWLLGCLLASVIWRLAARHWPEPADLTDDPLRVTISDPDGFVVFRYDAERGGQVVPLDTHIRGDGPDNI